MNITSGSNANFHYALLTDEELQLLKKAESDINSRRKERVFLIGFSQMSEVNNTGAKA